MSDANEEGLVKSILRKLAGTLGFVLCAVGILGFLVSGFAIDYIDERIEAVSYTHLTLPTNREV